MGDEDEAAAGDERGADSAREVILLGFEDVAERAEAGDDVELAIKGVGDGVALEEADGDAGLSVAEGAGGGEHTSGEVDADDLVGAERAQGADGGACAAAHVERGGERAGAAEGVGEGR